jgi:hypothetical protein
MICPVCNKQLPSDEYDKYRMFMNLLSHTKQELATYIERNGEQQEK